MRPRLTARREARIKARQLWESAEKATGLEAKNGCPGSTLAANSVITLADGKTLELASDAVYHPVCARATQPALIATEAEHADKRVSSSSKATSAGPGISDFRDPFYASSFPQCYALAATTIIAYTLFIMLVITPRSFLDGGVVVLGRRGGFTSGPTSGIDIGGRPWLQKVAALTVAISLTIATVDTFRVAEYQYDWGYQNAQEIQTEVLGGTQLKAIRLISDTFLWLAQAQTLIRLFPRHREKIIIKWTAFSLITLDVVFESLNSFQYSGPGNSRPRNFSDAVPALNYLFQLSLGLLYAAWVIYYSITKKRYAFYHPLMKNICLVAALSIFSILVPVVFFILDISKPDFTAWGDYVRWVGAAAASVVVWEWVERIEALEREEKKDGILGREVFDGDEVEPIRSDFSWPRRRKTRPNGPDGPDAGGEGGAVMDERSLERGKTWPAMSSIANRYNSRSGHDSRARARTPKSEHAAPTSASSPSALLRPPLWPARPGAALTPASRTETGSVDSSTVYAVRYQPSTEASSQTLIDSRHGPSQSRSSSETSQSEGPSDHSPAPSPTSDSEQKEKRPGEKVVQESGGWRSISRLLKLGSNVGEPPPEVVAHTQRPQRPRQGYEGGRWDIRARIEDFAATQAERIRERMRPTVDTDSLPVTVIPAPPRPGAALAQVLEEEELEISQSRAREPPAPPTQGRDSPAPPPPLSPAQRLDTIQLRSVRRSSAQSSAPSCHRTGQPTENLSRPSARDAA